MDNRVLKTSLIVGRILEILIYIAIVVMVVFFCSLLLFGVSIDWIWFDPANISFTISTGDRGSDLLLSQIPDGILTFMFIKSAAVLIILSVMIRQMIKILYSLRSLNTFKTENVQVFRRIGNLFIIWFAVEIPSVAYLNQALSISVFVIPSILLGTLICYLLSEIFKEGNRLMEDNKLTI